MASSSHNGALLFGLLAGAAAGAACAIWNATESGEKLRGETLAMIDAALGRTHQTAAPALEEGITGSGAVDAPLLAQ